MAIYVGTSGWSYPHWGHGIYYPQGLPQSEWLRFYAEIFPAVEINNTFYHLPEERIFANWRDSTPAEFRFAVKASRFITHMKKLAEPEVHVARFLEHAAALREKLSVVLFQLPSFWKFNQDRVEAFASFLSSQRIIRPMRAAIEFRHPSWLCPSVIATLRRHRIALVQSDPPGLKVPMIHTADFLYFRRHRLRYSAAALMADASTIQEHINKARDIFCFFNNDARAAAIHDALALTKKILNKTVALPPDRTLDSPLLFQEP
jgi:uncharacterized protein YecE (DUF72 family)